MKKGPWRRLTWVQHATLGLAVYLLAVLKALQSAPDTWLPVPWLKANFWWQSLLLIGILVLVYPLGWFFRWRTRVNYRSPSIRAMLDLLHRFTGSHEAEPHRFRVTLFRARKSWRGKASWLTIYDRSGHRTHGSRTRFRINADREHANEGVAGQCWYQTRSIVVTALPDVSGPADEDDMCRYAEATYCELGRLRTLRPKSRCLGGTAIMVNGEPWGCLVLDSETPNAFDESVFNSRPVRECLRSLSEALVGD